jgi:NADPH2 dehydrogenase
MPILFTPVELGQCTLKHRIAMSPMTRKRADDLHVPLPFVHEYYSQRASVPGTLIISEGTFISPHAAGFSKVPGIWNMKQVNAWKDIVDSVHAKGSVIYCQLWALGRAAKVEVLQRETRSRVVSSSATPMQENGPVPHELEESEIQNLILEYARAAKNAISAGFDGVEIHGANGYLIDQFTQDTCNTRMDNWGGNVQKRARFALEVTNGVVKAIGADKVGIRLSPYSTFQGMRMKDPIPQFSYLLENLRVFKLAYVHLVESKISGSRDVETAETLDFAIGIWGKTSPIILTGGFDARSAREAVEMKYQGLAIIIGFGRHFLSTPDLPFRLREGIQLEKYDRGTFYSGHERGYTDYPFCTEFLNLKN